MRCLPGSSDGLMQFSFSGNLPVIPLEIGVSAAREEWLAGKLEPAPRRLRLNALVDSGATISIVDLASIETLRISPRGDCNIAGFCFPSQLCENFDVGLNIASGDEHFKIPDLQVAGAHLQDGRYSMLLGADVLKHFELTLNLRDGLVILNPLP